MSVIFESNHSLTRSAVVVIPPHLPEAEEGITVNRQGPQKFIEGEKDTIESQSDHIRHGGLRRSRQYLRTWGYEDSQPKTPRVTGCSWKRKQRPVCLSSSRGQLVREKKMMSTSVETTLSFRNPQSAPVNNMSRSLQIMVDVDRFRCRLYRISRDLPNSLLIWLGSNIRQRYFGLHHNIRVFFWHGHKFQPRILRWT